MAGPVVTKRHLVSTILIEYGEHHFDGIFRHEMKSILIESANMTDRQTDKKKAHELEEDSVCIQDDNDNGLETNKQYH